MGKHAKSWGDVPAVVMAEESGIWECCRWRTIVTTAFSDQEEKDSPSAPGGDQEEVVNNIWRKRREEGLKGQNKWRLTPSIEDKEISLIDSRIGTITLDYIGGKITIEALNALGSRE